MSDPHARNDSDDRMACRLDKYRLTRRIGRGGMGVVYEAEDALLQRRVAIKLLNDELAPDSEPLRRLLHEAQAAARLNHPNAVTIYEIGRDDVHYIAMELVDGASAQDFLDANGPFHWLEATRVIADACRALVAAHDAGLVHRDIKPANIMRSNHGVVKLADFGLAKITDRPGLTISTPGTLVGTPHFMSPEQCRSDPVDDLSDVYSLGATYFALLVGRPPFPGQRHVQVMYAHCSSPAPNPRDHDERVPEAVAAAVLKAMAKRPEDRFQSAAELLRALEAILAHAGTNQPTPPPLWARAVQTLHDPPCTPRSGRNDSGPHPDSRYGTRSAPATRSKLRRAIAALTLAVLGAAVAAWAARRPLAPSLQPGVVESKQTPPAIDPTAVSPTTNDHPSFVTTAPEKPSPTAPASMQLRSLSEPILLPGVPTALAVSPTDSQVALACRPAAGDDVVCLVDPRTATLRQISTADVHPVDKAREQPASKRARAIALHRRSKQLVVALDDGEVAGVAELSLTPTPVWKAWVVLPVRKAHMLALSRDGEFVAAATEHSAGQPATVGVWNRNEQAWTLQHQSDAAVTAIAFSPATNQTLAVGHGTGTVTIWDGAEPREHAFEASESIRSLCFASGGNFVGAAAGRSLVIYSLRNRQSLAFRTAGDAESLAFLPTGQTLLGGSTLHGRGAIDVFRMPELNSRDRIDAHAGTVHLMAFSVDGVLFTAGSDRTLRQWRLHAPTAAAVDRTAGGRQ